MKYWLTILVYLIYQQVSGQGGIWVWMNGSQTVNTSAVYGPKGVISSTTQPPGLYEPGYWLDHNGDLWVYGGLKKLGNTEGSSSDLWRYTPSLNMWTWMNGGVASYGIKGVPATTNYPGQSAWCSLTWTDKAGNLWLYGGVGISRAPLFGYLNAMWKYDVQSNLWTWMWGSADSVDVKPIYGTALLEDSLNSPGSRAETSATWVDDDNNLWFFGGLNSGPPYMCMNDIWKFNTTTLNWTWIKGSTFPNDIGVYGTKGVESPLNHPSGRSCNTSWKDDEGNLYLFGGMSNYQHETFNDVWRFNPTTSSWTWLAGETSSDARGSFDGYCEFSSTADPMARGESRSARNSYCHNSFLLSGGVYTKNAEKSLNELWEFNPKDYTWKFISGDTIGDNIGVFGTLGHPTTSNELPAIYGHCVWTDADNNIWIFGGRTETDTGFVCHNTVWKFIPLEECYKAPIVHGIKLENISQDMCTEDSVQINLSGSANFLITPNSNITKLDSNAYQLKPTQSTTYLITAETECNTNDSLLIDINISKPTASFDFNPPITTLDDPKVELRNLSTQPSSESWKELNNAPPVTNNAYIIVQDTGVYCYELIATDTIGCKDTSENCIQVFLPSFVKAPDAFSPNGDGINDYFTVFGQNIASYEISIFNRWGEVVYHSVDINELNSINHGWDGALKDQPISSSDVYSYSIKSKDILNKELLLTGSIFIIK